MSAYELFKIISDKNRFNILQCIGSRCEGKSVNEIASCTKLEQSLLSHHLQKLRENGLVRSRTEGKQRIYTISSPEILAAIERATNAFKHIATEPLGITGEKMIENGILSGNLKSKKELLESISSFEKEFTLLFGGPIARKMVRQMRKVAKEMT